ncbi:WD domain-containing protein [Geopyxis carbonaria]|nr:WD domain-containing protein [Geopyxis carbonaria]
MTVPPSPPPRWLAHALTPPAAPAPYLFATLKARTYNDHSRNAAFSIRDLAWNAPGNRIACALSDKLVRVWNPDKPDLRNSTELKGHTAPVAAVVWDPTHSDRLASCSADHTVRFWDYRSKACAGVVGTGGENTALAWAPDGRAVAVAARDDKVHFIDTRAHARTSTHSLPAPVHGIAFSHSGETLLMATAAGKVLLYDFPSLTPSHSVDAHASAALCLELDPRGVHLAVGGSDAVVGLWDTTEWICLRTLRGMGNPVKCISFSFDGSYICAGSDEIGSHDIEIIHVDTGDLVHTVTTTHPITRIKWHPTKYCLAYSGDPSGLKILNVADSK